MIDDKYQKILISLFLSIDFDKFFWQAGDFLGSSQKEAVENERKLEEVAFSMEDYREDASFLEQVCYFSTFSKEIVPLHTKNLVKYSLFVHSKCSLKVQIKLA